MLKQMIVILLMLMSGHLVAATALECTLELSLAVKTDPWRINSYSVPMNFVAEFPYSRQAFRVDSWQNCYSLALTLAKKIPVETSVTVDSRSAGRGTYSYISGPGTTVGSLFLNWSVNDGDILHWRFSSSGQVTRFSDELPQKNDQRVHQDGSLFR